jgi:4-oxalocrotonate tautomerase
MPLVRIELRSGTSPQYRKAIAAGVHQAMIDALAIPPEDHFQVVSEHSPDGLIYDPQFLGVQRSDKMVFIQITMSAGRKPQQKRKLYKRIVEHLSASPGAASAGCAYQSRRGFLGELVFRQRRRPLHGRLT